MGQAAADDGVAKPTPGGDPDALAVKKGALAALGDKKIVVGRVVGERGDDDAVALKCDRNREMWNAVQEIGGAVERIDDPAVGLVGTFAKSAFLAEKSISRPCFGKLLVDDLFGAAVGGGDKITRSLDRNLQLLDLAQIALEASSGAVR